MEGTMKGLGVPIGWFIGLIVLMMLALWFKVLGTAESIQIFLMFTLVLVTAQYAVSTHKMAELSKSEQEWTMRPYISLKGEISEEAVHSEELDYIRLTLVLTNQGRTPTKNVVVNYEFQSAKLPIITQEGNFMCEDMFGDTPCTCVFELSDEMRSRLEKNEQVRFKMKVTYRSVFGKEHQTIYRCWRNAPTKEWVAEHCEWT